MNDRSAKAGALGEALTVAFVAAAVGVVLPLAAITAIFAAGVELQPAGVVALSILLTQGVSFGGVALLYLAVRRGRIRVPLRWPTSNDLHWMAGGSLLALAALGIGLFVVSTLGLSIGEHQLQDVGAGDPEIFMLLIPLSFLLIGPVEELLFRGIVQGRLRQTFSAGTAIALAAVTFAAMHLMALSGPLDARLTAVAVLLLPSLVFGLAYERSGNIAVPAVIHGTYNAVLLAASYSAVQAAGGG
jgi:uncharacterized protein